MSAVPGTLVEGASHAGETLPIPFPFYATYSDLNWTYPHSSTILPRRDATDGGAAGKTRRYQQL